MREEDLQTGKLEPTNKPYASAKLVGVVLCQSYCREYGDNFIAANQPTILGHIPAETLL
jgi:GDP-L-fucose synthase